MSKGVNLRVIIACALLSCWLSHASTAEAGTTYYYCIYKAEPIGDCAACPINPGDECDGGFCAFVYEHDPDGSGHGDSGDGDGRGDGDGHGDGRGDGHDQPGDDDPDGGHGNPHGPQGPLDPWYCGEDTFALRCGDNCCVKYTFVECRETTGVVCPGTEECAIGACCSNDGCEETEPQDCGGSYAGNNSSCDPTIGCCKEDGSCLDTASICCEPPNEPLDGTCPNTPTGACCCPGDPPTCVSSTQECCEARGCQFHGGGSTCCDDGGCRPSSIKVKTISFTGPGETPLRKTNDNFNNDTYVSEGSPIVDPVWTDMDLNGAPEKQDPICYEFNTSPFIEARLEVDGPGCPSASNVLVQVKTLWGDYKRWQGYADLSDGEIQVTLEPVEGYFRAQVDQHNLRLGWTATYEDGDEVDLGTTKHTAFVNLDVVPEGVTAKRMSWCVNSALGLTWAEELAEKYHDIINEYFDLNDNCAATPWKILDDAGTAGYDCISLSHLKVRALHSMGVPGATVDRVYASTDNDYSSKETRACPDGSHTGAGGGPAFEELLVQAGGWNNYEACMKFGPKWYLGGIDYIATSHADVMDYWINTAGGEQFWVANTPGGLVEHGPPVPLP